MKRMADLLGISIPKKLARSFVVYKQDCALQSAATDKCFSTN